MSYAIETNNLSKFYGDVRALHQVNLRVKRGEIYGFLGLNGAGKTTTIRALLGMIRPSEGNVKVLDQVIGRMEAGLGRRWGISLRVQPLTPKYPSAKIWILQDDCMGLKIQKL